MPICPVCARENADDARFCSACGAALTAEPPREERKVVTVLFADLVGFTSRAEELDPEDVRAVLAPYWERLRGELEQRGGTVEKFIGDAVMALFGAPVAHDDDPLRAVGAALAIRDWAREEGDVQVRVAVNTGEALVVVNARPGEGEGMAAGDVVNTAARLQSAAPVNGVLVGETTYRATRDVIEYLEHEPVVAKGKTEPVAVWEAVQVRSRLGVDVERATLPLIGRTRELGVIVDAFERAKAEREPQLVTLVGVPGIGKSRLVGEFFARLDGQPELVWWRQGRALPYGDGVSLWALAEMVKAQAGIDENDDEATAAAKLRASVELVVDDDEDRSWVLDHLLPLVGIERGAAGGDSGPAWRRYFEGLAEQRPLVLVFEDMHWADEALLDFVDHLVDWATGVPLLVIATARPELLDRRPSWGGGKLNVSTIALTPLSDEESAAIIHGVLEQSALAAETQHALVERAGGNPLYAEQFARLYLERGSADDLPLPETVQGLIAARLDGLALGEKRVIQEASVFGKVFWAGAIDAAPETLHSLERKGMVRRERRSSVAGETQYAFRHVLVRDVAYGQIPRAARGDKHVRAADWIEALGRSEDHAELVAHHLGTALELGVAVENRARLAFRRAGERAQALGAWPPAERYFARALSLWPDDDPQRPALLAAHARARFRAQAETDALESALEVLERSAPAEDAAELAAFAANAMWYTGRAVEARRLIDRAAAGLAGLPPSRALALVLAERARLALFENRHHDATADGSTALELATHFEMEELQAQLLATAGVVRLVDGDLAGAEAAFEQAAELAAPGSAAELRALSNLAVVPLIDGDRDRWRRLQERAVEAAARAGDAANLRWLEAQAIEIAIDEGRWDDALRRADDFLAHGRHYQEHVVLLHKAFLVGARGSLEDARRLRDEGYARVAHTTEVQVLFPSRMFAAGVSLVIGDEERARELVAELEPMLPASGHRAPAANALLVWTIARVGDIDAWFAAYRSCAPTRRVVAACTTFAGELLDAAEAWAEVSPRDEAFARLHAAEGLVAAGRRAEADVQLERGLAFFRAVGATRVVEHAQALLAAAS